VQPTEPWFSPEVLRPCRSSSGDEVYGEFNYVNEVNLFADKMDTVLTDMQIGSMGTLHDVYEAVKLKIDPPEDSKLKYNTGIIIRGLLTAGTSLAKNPYIKGAMGVINGALSIGMSLSKRDGGEDYNSLETTALNLPPRQTIWENARLERTTPRWSRAIGASSTMLKEIYDRADVPPSGWTGLMYSDTDPTVWNNTITNSLEAFYFQSLLPAVFKIDYVQDTYTFPSPKNFWYNGNCNYGYCPCPLYCGVPDTAYWVDECTTVISDRVDFLYSWYVLEDEILYALGCDYVDYERSNDIRDVLLAWGIGVTRPAVTV
jgi:hypothetical protein